MNIKKVNKSVKVDIKEELRKIYPEVFESGKINFEKLKALLSGEIIEKEDDRFYFNWAGKSGIFKLIQAPAYGTLKPDKEKSVDFDKTENVVIVGENLETLKLLLKPYFGKIKMIYIDPPYNTGKDFIYRDNFKEPLKDYLEKTGQIDVEGKKLTTNTETSGRYHSDWLNFMYPRLFLARSLLRDDGVIFISIDDNEVHHLRMIMDEIFGEENFVAQFIWRKKRGHGRGDNLVIPQTEYIVNYAKNQNLLSGFRQPLSQDKLKYYKYEDEKGLYARETLEHHTPKGAYIRKTLQYDLIIDGKKIFCTTGQWLWKRERVLEEWKKGNIDLEQDKEGRWRAYKKIYLKVNGENRKEVPISLIDDSSITNNSATIELKNILGSGYYDFPKPSALIKKLLAFTTDSNNSLILDFFAGSGTTGHAVWDLNKEDGGNRKSILVQLDEEVQDEEIKKEFPTVADICIERLKRVSEKYKKENPPVSPFNKGGIEGGLDFGFKVFKLDKSNFNLKDEFEIQEGVSVEELKKKYLEWLAMYVNEPLIPGWKKIDVIYEIMLKEGLNLNSKIEQLKIKENNFYYVNDIEQNLEFYICLEDKIATDTIEEIRTTKYKGKMFVFIDKALTDNDKINLSAFVRLKVI